MLQIALSKDKPCRLVAVLQMVREGLSQSCMISRGTAARYGGKWVPTDRRKLVVVTELELIHYNQK